MKPAAVVLLVLGGLSAVPAHAQSSGSYVGLSYVWSTYTADNFPTANPKALSIRVGWAASRYFALEARGTFNVGTDTVTYQGAPVDVELVKAFGGYLKGILPVSDAFSLYALAGAVGGRVKATGAAYEASQSKTGLSLGAGIDLAFDRHWGLALEWAQLFGGETYKVQAASLGLTYRY